MGLLLFTKTVVVGIIPGSETIYKYSPSYLSPNEATAFVKQKVGGESICYLLENHLLLHDDSTELVESLDKSSEKHQRKAYVVICYTVEKTPINGTLETLDLFILVAAAQNPTENLQKFIDALKNMERDIKSEEEEEDGRDNEDDEEYDEGDGEEVEEDMMVVENLEEGHVMNRGEERNGRTLEIFKNTNITKRCVCKAFAIEIDNINENRAEELQNGFSNLLISILLETCSKLK
ncbi:hypothetical protein COEREDRAFT_88358 [Coemansia reversa NRRL 1564]|uniref:Uncharacterized protein n=1 Tax=Coemansia reversa (strain ATCC 12441 / NRRL 1564) TaxID=763665 RepID=A0A2G5B711_COERN|nr:hypothetical protein COEREDRAFT_88358 [Coemansia reversa NRRL 1564]|eukprot:PIA14833.1 hypothetical protein COEREDRAFT_88358 [Coemansia reversa NRRL 1564]